MAISVELLYMQIPDFECVEGCTDCCGPIPATEGERKNMSPEPEKIGPHCPWEIPGKGCATYETRPFMCRLFGASDVTPLRCPYGKGPVGPLTAEQARNLTDSYNEIFEAQDSYIHLGNEFR